MNEIEKTFNNGIISTFNKCCVDKNGLSSCDFFPSLCTGLTTPSEMKNNIIQDMKSYTNTILRVFITTMLIEVSLSLISIFILGNITSSYMLCKCF